MKAVVQDSYGPPEDLRIEDVPAPQPRKGQVLLRVHAVSLNASDAEIKTGYPGYVRIYGVRKPRMRVLGTDVAGVVEAVGEGVTRFAPGDRVFGDILGTFGGLAEFAAVREKLLTPIPADMGFETAAAIPQGAALVHQGLTRPAPMLAGQRMLINGAGGSAGTFAVQMAKNARLHVTAVDRAEKLEALAELGADLTVDFARVDFSASGQKWDRILDVIATRPARHVAAALAPGGTYWAVGGAVPVILNILIAGALIGLRSNRRIAFLGVDQSPKALAAILPQIASGAVRPVIDSRVRLEDAPKALRRQLDGKAFGKIIVVIQGEGSRN